MVKNIFVVTISELMAAHANEIDLEAFRSRDAAIAWIEKQISAKIDTYDLPEGSVDGWCVAVGGESHTIQYDIKECMLK